MRESTEVFARHNLFDLCQQLQVCDLQLIVLDGPGPHLDLHQCRVGELSAVTCTMGFRSRASFALPDGWCMLMYVHAVGSDTSWYQGTTLSEGQLLTLLPGMPNEMVLEPGTIVTHLLIRTELLAPYCGGLSRQHLPAIIATTPEHPIHARYRSLDRSLRQAADAVTTQELKAIARAHAEAVAAASPLDKIIASHARRVRYISFRQAEDFARGHMREEIYIKDLCSAAGISPRTLQNVFFEFAGISPNRYLSALRLSAACCSLSAPDGGRRSISSVAMNCGIWDMSRFSAGYRRAFGELPRDTQNHRRAA
ncbi:AraC family transcriptional regulator, ethanolamine operon transcriptional activator [Pseudoxanthomonas sp. GM95]|uniref:helix-turn-helix transcriptional regulator n=1 Tax=Pseudoxanthomonas sp. GM95 TaxID=1881043 RepID=UPI0008D042E3|nr:helix-turn-helix transcriptional regulator [Pseudoxanthomonas sp. GM95]SEL00730.1 AraC family transcriptional regulator, ethanolamine operon transcriptional activator [Pseudoxanthomonas sp. GM95]